MDKVSDHITKSSRRFTFLCFAILERLEADASRSRESLTPPSLNPAYKIEPNHDDDSGDLLRISLYNIASSANRFINDEIFLLASLVCQARAQINPVKRQFFKNKKNASTFYKSGTKKSSIFIPFEN